MIRVTRLGRDETVVLNAELIQRVEALPDTTITLTGGEQFLVQESLAEVVRRVIAYKREILRRRLPRLQSGNDDADPS